MNRKELQNKLFNMAKSNIDIAENVFQMSDIAFDIIGSRLQRMSKGELTDYYNQCMERDGDKYIDKNLED